MSTASVAPALAAAAVPAMPAARGRRILGLDPGSERFGYGVIDLPAAGGGPVYVAAGVLTVPGGWPKFRRLGELGREVGLLIDEYLPTDVALEAGFVWRAKPARALDECRGIAIYLAASRGLQIAEYAPATVKQATTGHGGSKKEQVAALVVARLGMKRVPMSDAADALAVAITHAVAPAHSHGSSRPPRAAGRR